MSNIEDIREHLTVHGQEHLLKFWDTLADFEKNELLGDINEINFETVLANYREAISASGKEDQVSDNIEPIPESLYRDVNKITSQELKSYEQLGLKMISESKVAVLVMAGGQGTRLGVPYPKGMYDVGLLSGKTLFQIQAERILRLEELAFQQTGQKGSITWLVMTSESTMESTSDFFKKRSYFGLQEQNVIIFEQFMLPAFSFEGKIILADRHRISMSPDGNGGLYRALRDRKVLDLMEKRNIQYVHAHSIDNILVKVGDPLFLGYCAHNKADTCVKVVEKTVPEEPIGVVCLVNEKWKVVEYSEIPPKVAEKRADDGSLVFNAGNICNHVFSTSFLRKIAMYHCADLELHVAKKKIETIDETGKPVKPNSPNGTKIERFIFDVFPFAEKLVVWKVNREEEFSGLKNSDSVGKDCPATVRKDLYNLHRCWIEKNGGKFKVEAADCEISPLVSYGGENLEELVRGKIFQSPCLLKAKCE